MSHRTTLARAISLASIAAIVFSIIPMQPFTADTAFAATSVFINEIHYDNTGTDTGEAVEIAGPAGTDLTGWSLVLYNGNGGGAYNTLALSGVLPDAGAGYGALAFTATGLQNGSPDGLALVDDAPSVVQFLSYEGSFTATDGPANGMTSVDIGVSESSSPIGESLQLVGTGTLDEDFTWTGPTAESFGEINAGQGFGSGGPTATPTPIPPTSTPTPIPPTPTEPPPAGPPDVSMSEMRIDQPGSDNDEYFELAGASGTALDGLTYLVIGDGTGASGVIESVTDLSGQAIGGSGYFVAAESTFSLASADFTGTLGFENSDNVTHLLVWEFTGTDGDDLDGDDDGVLDVTPWTSVVDSVALVETPGSGDQIYSGTTVGPDGSFVPGHAYLCEGGWEIGAFDPVGGNDTPGSANDCAIEPPSVQLSEIRIDQPSTDNDEYFELAGAGGTSLDGLTYLVIGDGTGASGVIENVTDLAGQSIGGSGYFVGAESTFGLGTADLTTSLNFENSDNVTHLLVWEFSGANGDDLDSDDDGVLDTTPWTSIIDSVALVETPGSGDQIYSGTTVGPDGSFVPGHAYLCPSGWEIGAFDPAGGSDTPGAANICAVEPPSVQLNEIRIDQPSTDNDEYFELSGAGGTSLDGLTYLVIGDGTGASGVIENVTDLAGQSIGGSGFFVAAEGTFSLGSADLTTSLNFENSDNVTHLLVAGFSGANGDDLDSDDDGVLDSTPWTSIIDSVALVETPGSGDQIYSANTVGPDGSFVPGHAYRCDDGWEIGPFDPAGGVDTPGAANDCPTIPPFAACGAPATFIHMVQGAGDFSPLVNEVVVVEGVVVGDFQGGYPALGGFNVQEEDAQADADDLTSEGIFVFQGSSGVAVSVGDVVRVRGSVDEYFGLTEINDLMDVEVCSSGGTATAAELLLPVDSTGDFERLEGMAVSLPQELYISEFFNFDRFGEIVLTNERQFQPTASFEPGSAAWLDAMQTNLLGRITLDDASTDENPDPARHPNGAVFDLGNRFRGGDTVADVVGVVDYAFGIYRIQPTGGATYTAVNPRPASPDDVGGGVQVASFNVLNYFTTLDNAGPICGPGGDQGCRGADDADEFTRQRDKIIAALVDIGADVVGLIEIENHPADVPTADLVSGLNDVLGAGSYDFITTGAIGTDAIRVAIIYRPDSVTPMGPYAILDESVDARFLDDFNRPALAQTFMDNATGGVFTVAINHLKSKGSACDSIGDPDAGDGQGNCNLTRTSAAEALVDWLATDPTGSGAPDYLIMGDLNAYDKEDPIDAILAGPDDTDGTGDDWTDLVFNYVGEDAYSYVFDGQLGYLDHALGSPEILDDVTGATIWHINADEPDLLDYDTTFKEPAQDALYEPNAYRSSDHDPVIVGLDVCETVAPTLSVTLSPDTLWPPNHMYVEVLATIVAEDNFDPDPMVTLVSATSNEPDNGLGDGDTADDIVIVDTTTLMLRAERSGTGDGRVYTVTYAATDLCGNQTLVSATVEVPLGKGHKN